jgi:hypothetical protein
LLQNIMFIHTVFEWISKPNQASLLKASKAMKGIFEICYFRSND